jgi:hypothetical protein
MRAKRCALLYSWCPDLYIREGRSPRRVRLWFLMVNAPSEVLPTLDSAYHHPDERQLISALSGLDVFIYDSLIEGVA